MAKKRWPDVVEGQIWRDRDPRMFSGNRRVRVYRVIGSPGAIVHDVLYQQVIGCGNTLATNNIFKSRYTRFQRAFDLLQSADAVARSAGDSTT